MRNLITKFLAVFVLSITLLPSAMAIPAGQSDNISKKACEQTQQAGGTLAGCGEEDKKYLGGPGGWFNDFVDVLIYIAAIVSFIFLLVGAIQYITSDGQANRVEQAKQTVLYSVIGLAVAILARLIVGFVINRV